MSREIINKDIFRDCCSKCAYLKVNESTLRKKDEIINGLIEYGADSMLLFFCKMHA